MKRKRNSKPVVRRFEMGASGFGHDDFLAKLGYKVTSRGGHGAKGFWVTMPGAKKPRKIGQMALIALLDEERVKRGLEPILGKHRK